MFCKLSLAQESNTGQLWTSSFYLQWEGLLKTLTSTRNQSTENVVTNITNLSNSSTEETKPKRTADIIDQPRPRFYGFTDWKMYKDYNKRMCVKEHYATRMRLNALRKNTILPKEIRVWRFYSFHVQLRYIHVADAVMGCS